MAAVAGAVCQTIEIDRPGKSARILKLRTEFDEGNESNELNKMILYYIKAEINVDWMEVELYSRGKGDEGFECILEKK